MHNDQIFPPAIVRAHVEQLFEQAAVALHNAERCEAESMEWYCKLGKTLLQGQEAHGVYGWTKLAAERLGRSERQIQRYMKVAKVEPGTDVSEQWGILNGHSDQEIRTYDENPDASVGVSDDEDEQAPARSDPPKRSGLWESSPRSALVKLPGAEQVMPKENYVAKLPQLVLAHLKHLMDALAHFSRCDDLPADEERFGERLKAVRDWTNRVVPEAKPKPRKKPYRKRCNKCKHEFTMAMKEDYTWVPLDDPDPDLFGHWELVEDVAYFHKQAQAGLRMAHYKTCPKDKANEPVPE